VFGVAAVVAAGGVVVLVCAYAGIAAAIASATAAVIEIFATMRLLY
jgi:hypothetical protein